MLGIETVSASATWRYIRSEQHLRAGDKVQLVITDGNDTHSSKFVSWFKNVGGTESSHPNKMYLYSGGPTFATDYASYQPYALTVLSSQDGDVLLQGCGDESSLWQLWMEADMIDADNLGIFRNGIVFNHNDSYPDSIQKTDLYIWRFFPMGEECFGIRNKAYPNGFLAWGGKCTRCEDMYSSISINNAAIPLYSLDTARFYDQIDRKMTLSASLENNLLPASWKVLTLFQDFTTTFYPANGTWMDGTSNPLTISDSSYYHWPLVKAPDGYALIGWNTDKDMLGADIVLKENRDGYHIPQQNRVVYAEYVPILSSTVLNWTQQGVVVRYSGAATRVETKVCYSGEECNPYCCGQYGDGVTNTLDATDCKLDECTYLLKINTEDYQPKNAGCYVIFTYMDDAGHVLGVERKAMPLVVKTTSEISMYSSWIDLTTDIVVLGGRTLTVSEHTICRTLTICADACVIVPEDMSLTVTELTMQSGTAQGDVYSAAYPQLVAKGRVYTNDQIIYYDYLLNDAHFYPLSLPYNARTSDITYADGMNHPVFGIQAYDGKARAEKRVGWKYVYSSTEGQDTILHAGIGYTIYAEPQQVQRIQGERTYLKYSALRIPMQADLSSGDGLLLESKSVPVHAYGHELMDVTPNNIGWNLVGNPYLATINHPTGLSEYNGIGLLEENNGEYEWVGKVRYVVVPNLTGTYYRAYRADQVSIKPFTNFFIQIGQGDALSFGPLQDTWHSPLRKVRDVQPECSLTLTMQQDGVKDETVILLGDEYTDAYEINADLEKWINRTMNVYVLSKDGERLSYAALPLEGTSLIPIGIQTAQGGTFTLAVPEDVRQSGIWSAIDLTDKSRQVTTDLLKNDYIFTAASGIADNRFVLHVSSQPQMPTATQMVTDDENVQVWDLMGRLVKCEKGASRIKSLPQGIYIVSMHNTINPILLTY